MTPCVQIDGLATQTEDLKTNLGWKLIVLAFGYLEGDLGGAPAEIEPSKRVDHRLIIVSVVGRWMVFKLPVEIIDGQPVENGFG
jgi:hypothetical protein